MPKLSVVLATFNEEENIGGCLDSIRQLADEIVIVDGGSTDRTIEIAKKYSAHIFITDNPPLFHINKQKAIDAAIGDWILQLDADERVNPELLEEIKKVIAKSEGNPSTHPAKRDFAQAFGSEATQARRDNSGAVNGYWIPRKNWFLGRFLMKGGQYPDYTLRLYKKGKGRLPQKTVHEQAVVEGEVGYITHSLLHYPYKNFSVYLKKWNRYVDLLSVEIKETLIKRNLVEKMFYGVGYLLLKPLFWFLMTYVRHKGFMDSWQGFVFAFFSSLRFPVAYIRSFSY